MKYGLHAFRLHLALLVLSSILLLPIEVLPSPQPGQNETWIGIFETAGLWGSMQLKLILRGADWKSESSFNVGGNELSKPVRALKRDGADISFSTELQAMDTHFTLHFSGKRYGNKLRGSVSAIRDDGTVTSGTWDLQLQPSGERDQTAELPAPTGRYPIGRTSFHWKDLSRPEVMTVEPRDVREVMVHVWYPAEQPTTSSSAAYFPDFAVLKSAFSESERLVLASVRSHAVNDAPIAASHYAYPVLIFSPGAGMSSFFYTSIIEELTSHGYIVAAIDHSYESQPVVFPDERIAKYDESQVKDVLRFARERIEVRAADTSFVIDQLAKLQRANARFRNHIDLTRIGILGHSRGGLAAAMACQRDPRLKACLNMDGGTLGGPFYHDRNSDGPQQPFMWFIRFKPEPSDEQLGTWKMTREQWNQNRDRIESRVNGYFQNIRSVSYRVTLNGATHETFSDLPVLLSKDDLQALAFRTRLLRIVRDLTLAFFDRHLRNERPPVLNGALRDYPEVTLEQFGVH
jgi:pimeloyl-ACP methyl ester carboxylesterase